MEEEEEGGKDLQKTKVLSLEWKIKGWWNNNNNNDRLTAFDPGQPG